MGSQNTLQHSLISCVSLFVLLVVLFHLLRFLLVQALVYTSFTYSQILPAIPSCILNSTSVWLLYHYTDAYLTPFKGANTEAIGLYVIILMQYMKFYTLFSIIYSDTSLWNHVTSSFQHSLQYYKLVHTYFYTWEVESSMFHPLYMWQRMIQQVLAH